MCFEDDGKVPLISHRNTRAAKNSTWLIFDAVGYEVGFDRFMLKTVRSCLY